MSEVLVGPGEELAEETHQGIAQVRSGPRTSAAAWVADRLRQRPDDRGDGGGVWLEAVGRPDVVPSESG